MQRGRWSALAARDSLAAALLVVGATFCVAAAGLALWPEPEPAAEEVDMQFRAPSRLRLRCDTCGVIESIRHTAATGGVLASYEFSVRLRDGTLRHSSDPQAGQWQVGDRMQLISGTLAP
jgi:hypothetical protein